VAPTYPQLILLDNPRQLSSAARNIGIRHAKGDLIVIVDGHCELEGPSYLRTIAESFQRSGADCLGRPQPLDVSEASYLQNAIATARSSWLGHHPDSFIYASTERFVPAKSVAVAYRRTVFEQIGQFDEQFDACEDVELNHRIDRAGLRCFFNPALRIRYFPRSSLHGLFQQMTRYGRGRIRLLRKHRDTFSLGGLMPALWLTGLLLGPVVCLNWPLLWHVYLATVVLYVAIVLAVSGALASRHRSLRFLGWLPLVYLTIHVGSGWGVLLEAVRPRRQKSSQLAGSDSGCSACDNSV
jgi:succinoglycan biosynthesis protein ExoA